MTSEIFVTTALTLTSLPISLAHKSLILVNLTLAFGPGVIAISIEGETILRYFFLLSSVLSL